MRNTYVCVMMKTGNVTRFPVMSPAAAKLMLAGWRAAGYTGWTFTKFSM